MMHRHRFAVVGVAVAVLLTLCDVMSVVSATTSVAIVTAHTGSTTPQATEPAGTVAVTVAASVPSSTPTNNLTTVAAAVNATTNVGGGAEGTTTTPVPVQGSGVETSVNGGGGAVTLAGASTAAPGTASHANDSSIHTTAAPMVECYQCTGGQSCDANNTCNGTSCWIKYDLTDSRELSRGCTAANSSSCAAGSVWASGSCQHCCLTSHCNSNAAVSDLAKFCLAQSAAGRLQMHLVATLISIVMATAFAFQA